MAAAHTVASRTISAGVCEETYPAAVSLGSRTNLAASCAEPSMAIPMLTSNAAPRVPPDSTISAPAVTISRP